jgi:hypothetical protein
MRKQILHVAIEYSIFSNDFLSGIYMDIYGIYMYQKTQAVT